MSAAELLLLEQLPEVGPVTVRRIVQQFGSAEAALSAPDGRFADVVGGPRAEEVARARRNPELSERVTDALRRAEDAGMTVVTWDDPEYPGTLRHLADPPPVLFLFGRVELLDGAPGVAVVGARRCTGRGRDVAGRLGTALGASGVTVVSGLALGIDGSAHAGCLRAGGDTIAVLGTGADVPYPRFHARLQKEIRTRGLLVSEFLPGTSAAPHHFPRRNRILAALSGAVVVVEAGRRSGALITVDHALDLGREVWSVPGPIDTPTCSGSNRLLADGARPLVSVDGFVEGLEGTAGGSAGRAEDGTQLSLLLPSLQHGDGSLEAAILRSLDEAPASADEMARRFDRPIATVLAVLTTLELHGEVVRLQGVRFRRAA